MTLAFIFSDVGAGEWLVLLAVILVVVGPRRLPEAARKFGQYYSKLRRAADAFKRQLLEMDAEVTRAADEATRDVGEAFSSSGDESQATPAPYTSDYADVVGYGPDGPVVESAPAAEPPAAAFSPIPSSPASADQVATAPSPSQSSPDAPQVATAPSPSQPSPSPAPAPSKPKVDFSEIKITVSPAPAAHGKKGA